MVTRDQLGLKFQPPERRVWTVRGLVAAVRAHVEREYSDAWGEGEISNFRAPDSGHLYFTLKDGNAQIRVVMFRSAARLLRFRPEGGMQVVVRGRVTIYEDRGELQIAAEYLEPKGAGGLQVAFEQLKAKLEAEGLFAAERKKAIPTLPARIGIVTSPHAAAAEVAAGVRYFNQSRNVEVIIVGRGGGPAEDLAAFNDEALARAVAASEIPVISAVGHETDFTIVDFVADLRAPTPSAAAELVIRSRVEVENQAEAVRERLVRAMERRLLEARHALTERAQHGAFARMMDLIRQRQQKLDDLTYRLERGERQLLERLRRRWEAVAAAVRHYDARRVLAGMRGELTSQTAALTAGMRNLLLQYRVRAERMGRALEMLSPLAILERGYALVFDGEGNLVKDAEQVMPGSEIRARVARGEIRATVNKAGGDAGKQKRQSS